MTSISTRFGDFFGGLINPNVLEIQDITDTQNSASFIDPTCKLTMRIGKNQCTMK